MEEQERNADMGKENQKRRNRKKNMKIRKAGICIGMAALLVCTLLPVPDWGWNQGENSEKTIFEKSDGGQTDASSATMYTYDLEETSSEEASNQPVVIQGEEYAVAEIGTQTEDTTAADETAIPDAAYAETDENAAPEENDATAYASKVKVKEIADASEVVDLINDTWETGYQEKSDNENQTQNESSSPELTNDGDDADETDDTYQLKRLMVLTGDELTDSYGAVDILHYAKYNQYVLQFETEEDTEYAYYELVSDYGKENCFVDEVVSDDTLAAFTGVTEYDTMSWGGSYMGFGYLKAEYDYYRIDSEVTVAVIDTGIDTSNRVFKNRIDKRHSFYFKGSDSVKKTSSYTDENGHGTHVAGIIADNTPENVSLMILKTFDGAGKSTNLAIRSALQYAVEQKADVVNMSLGWTGTLWAYSTYLKDVLKEAETTGTIICCAAGNKAMDVRTTYPANKENVITVSAINSNGIFAASYSNYGDTIDFSAPGTSVASTYLGGGTMKMSGTSMATPHISAAVAYVKMIEPQLNYKGVKIRLQQYAVDRGTLGWDENYGWGVVDLHDYFDNSNLTVKYTDYDENGQRKATPTAAFSKTKLTKKYGSAAYRYAVQTNSTGKVRYSSSNTAIAETDRSGYITIKKAGTCVITAAIDADANYRSSRVSYTLEVTPKDISGKKATLSKTSYTYAGKACKPSVTVSGLKASDYKVTYKNANQAGKAVCVITGTGNYTGTIKASYTIKLASSTITKVENAASGVRVTWKKISGAAGYRVYRKTKNGTWKRVGDVTSGKTVSFTDKTAKSGTRYEYRVRARKDSVFGGYSKKVSIRRMARPELTVKNKGKNIQLKWTSVKGVKVYKIYRKTGSGSYKLIGTTTSRSFKDTDVKAGKTYAYKVKAVNGSDKSAASQQIKIKKK